MALVDVAYPRPEVAAGLIGHDIEISLGLADTAYRGVVITPIPPDRILVQIPDELVRVTPPRWRRG